MPRMRSARLATDGQTSLVPPARILETVWGDTPVAWSICLSVAVLLGIGSEYARDQPGIPDGKKNCAMRAKPPMQSRFNFPI